LAALGLGERGHCATLLTNPLDEDKATFALRRTWALHRALCAQIPLCNWAAPRSVLGRSFFWSLI